MSVKERTAKGKIKSYASFLHEFSFGFVIDIVHI